jgi:GNAT superfamily N-acetyltransferase
MEYAVRDAKPDDIDEIVRVINLAYRVEDFFVNGNRTNHEEIGAWMKKPGSAILAVDSPAAGALAGCVCVDVHDRAGHFAMLSVDPAHQGKGLGRLLISAVEDHCRRAGCEELQLEVVNLRTELPPFYEAFGFATAGTIPFNKPNSLKREASLVRMRKPL